MTPDERRALEECRTCRYYRDDGSEISGDCRRHAPVVTDDGGMPKRRFPQVDTDDWCGDYARLHRSPDSNEPEEGFDADDLWQIDQAVEDAIAIPRPAGQVERLRAIREKIRARLHDTSILTTESETP